MSMRRVLNTSGNPLKVTNFPSPAIPYDGVVDVLQNVSYRKENATEELSENILDVPDCPFVFVIGTLLLSVGIVGNFATGTVILARKTLHTATFTAIACLAVSDLCSSISRYLLIRPMNVEEEINIIIETVAFFFLHSANFHMVLISYIRYVFVACPMVSLQITSRKVLRMSSFIWLVSLVISIIYSVKRIIYQLNFSSLEIDISTEIIFGLYVLGTPFLFVIFFHIRKILKMGHSFTQWTNSTVNIQKSMSVMLVIIIIIYLMSSLYPLFACVLDVICSTTTNRFDICWEFFDRYNCYIYLCQFCLLLNNCINPLIYFMFSPPMRSLYSTVRRFFTLFFSTSSEQ